MPNDGRMNSPQSVTRVIQILEALCASARPVSLADLSRALSMPKSSLAALLRGLTEADIGFGDQHVDGGDLRRFDFDLWRWRFRATREQSSDAAGGEGYGQHDKTGGFHTLTLTIRP